MLHNVLHLGEHGPLAPKSALDFVPFFESKHYPDGAWLARVALLIYKIWGPVCTSDLELSWTIWIRSSMCKERKNIVTWLIQKGDIYIMLFFQCLVCCYCTVHFCHGINIYIHVTLLPTSVVNCRVTYWSSSLKALRNALYKFETYLLTYLLTNVDANSPLSHTTLFSAGQRRE